LDHRDKTEDLVAYLQQLYTMKNTIEEWIAVLSSSGVHVAAPGARATLSVIIEHSSKANPSRCTLCNILLDVLAFTPQKESKQG
jgi:hypothetical protein